jgi:hypothetical protein
MECSALDYAWVGNMVARALSYTPTRIDLDYPRNLRLNKRACNPHYTKG